MNSDFDIRENVLYKYTGTQANVVIPDSVYIVHEKAFRFCESVVSIEVPDSVLQIRWGAFSFCPNLEKLTIGSSVNLISISAIEGCKNLKTIILKDNKDFYVKDNKIISADHEDYVISPEMLNSNNYSNPRK